MMSSFEVFEDYAYDVVPLDSIFLPRDGSLPSDGFHIQIRFRNLIFYYLPPGEDGERPFFTSQGPIQKQSFFAGRQAVLGKRSWTKMALMLSDLNVPSYVHPFIIQKIYSTAFSMACEASRTGRTVMPIGVRIVKSYFRTINEDEDELIARVSSLSMEDRACMPVPASKSSIEALEKVRLPEESDSILGVCMICLEEFSAKSAEVTRMPCSHIYHGGCIALWLENSHLCPLCRFEMPTD